jgi:DsbC/DsbD-like thiol-disulfide interchange protein
MMIKRIPFIAILLFFVSIKSNAQLENPVRWNFSAQKIGAKKYQIHLTATLQSGWHVYAQNAGEGPVSTSIVFSPNPLLKYDNIFQEKGKLETKYDPNFKSTLRFYSNTVDFVSNITSKSTASTVLNGVVKFMVCNDQKCLPPKEIPFKITLADK